MRAPFTPHPEEFDAPGLLTKSLELATLAVLCMLLGRLAQPSRPKYARIIARAVALGILTGGLMLFAGMPSNLPCHRSPPWTWKRITKRAR